MEIGDCRDACCEKTGDTGSEAMPSRSEKDVRDGEEIGSGTHHGPKSHMPGNGRFSTENVTIV